MQKTVKQGDIIIVRNYINVKDQNESYQGMKMKVGSVNNETGNIVGHRIYTRGLDKSTKGELVLTHKEDILAYGS